MVAPVTPSPGFFITGNDSPVTIDSSTLELPSTTSPSTGITSPGRTDTRSPTLTNEAGISCSPLSVTRRALSA